MDGPGSKADLAMKRLTTRRRTVLRGPDGGSTLEWEPPDRVLILLTEHLVADEPEHGLHQPRRRQPRHGP
jgi:hypothetical protein